MRQPSSPVNSSTDNTPKNVFEDYDENIQYSDPLLINFGKYKKLGLNIDELFEKDRKYCKWIFAQPFLKKNNSEIYDRLEELISTDNENSFRLNHGKYKGKTLKEVYDLDKNYIEYLKKQPFIKDSCKNIMVEIEFLESLCSSCS